jgi:TonB family protein
MDQGTMSNGSWTAAWDVRSALITFSILFSMSCSHTGSRPGTEQAKIPATPKAMANGTAPTQAYLALVQQRIRDVWKAPTLDFTNRTYATVVRFRLHKNGSVSLVKIEQSSSNESYDAAGKQAVLNASPLPAFPPDLSHAYVDAHITLTAPSAKE